MARINISVPDELKARMDAEDENWSEVARTVFERRLLEIATRKETMTMNDVVQRLRASKMQDLKAAKQLGRTWAMQTASFSELKALAHFEFTGEPMAPYRWLDLMFMAAKQWDDDQQGRPDDEVDTWWCEEVEGPSSPSDDTLEGFIEGAKEVWVQVEHEV
jgi:hypothetical protein